MIVPFPKTPCIIISSQLVTETRRHTGTGTTVVRHEPPLRMFFLDYEDGEGCCGVWDGSTYAGALDAARAWGADGCDIRDRTQEVWGRA